MRPARKGEAMSPESLPLFHDPAAEQVTLSARGVDQQRRRLHERFSHRISTRSIFTRRTVSYQGNRNAPGFRWMKYKEGFSSSLVKNLLSEHEATAVLDPFAGIGTVPLVAARQTESAFGIEIMPVGVLVGQGIAHAANGTSRSAFEKASRALVQHLSSPQQAPEEHGFPHVPITERAFPEETETAISKARQYISQYETDTIRSLLNLACMSVLEEVSYTRKDGQYLRWDYRSGRSLRSRVDKGSIATFAGAVVRRLSQMAEDMPLLNRMYGGGKPDLLAGSCLEVLRETPGSRFDMVITSPPYANRYDYTRTYALELAWLGFDRAGFADLRQRMLSATVENRTKAEWLEHAYGDDADRLNFALGMYENQEALHEVLANLRACVDELSNRHVIRLIEGYFLEMAVVVAELGRIVRPGGTVIMVNDNVQYHGEEVPVDFILSDFAEQSGFICKDIWVLPTGKGNSSQQMGRFGRREIRKCVYRWVHG